MPKQTAEHAAKLAKEKALPLMVGEAPDPDIFISMCCKDPKGLLTRIGTEWWLFRDAPHPGGQLATRAHPVAACRGCWSALDEKTPVRPWMWGVDKQLDAHIRQVARELGVTAEPAAAGEGVQGSTTKDGEARTEN